MRKIGFMLVAALFISAGSFGQNQKPNYGETPEDSIKCVQCLSLYSEFYKQDNYQDALKGWRCALKVCPSSSKNLYIRGTKMLKSFIDEAKKAGDDAKLNASLDTLLWLYDLRMTHFGEEGYVKGKKGADLMKYRKDNYIEAYNLMKESLELSGDEFDAGTMVYFYLSAYYMQKKEKISKDEFINLYTVLADIAEKKMKDSNPSIVRAYTGAIGNVEKYFIKEASCEEIINVFKPKFEEDGQNVDLLKQILATMDKRDCGDHPFYLEVAVALYAIEPDASAAYSIGIGYLKKENYEGSLEFFKKSTEGQEDQEELSKAYMYIAKASLKTRRLSDVRVYSRKALEINPNNGEAYLLIGDAYMATKIEGNECTSKGKYWAAYDKYLKAKSVDPSIAELANKKLSVASKQFPTKQDCFFHSIAEGAAFTVGDWIQENTTARVNE